MTNEDQAALVGKINASTERIRSLTARIDGHLGTAQGAAGSIPLSPDERIALRTLRLLVDRGVIGPAAG